VLDPDVVLRADGGKPALAREVGGAEAVASQAVTWTCADVTTQRVVINGIAGFLATRHGQPFSAGAFTVSRGKIVAIDILDPGRLARLTLTAAQG
jgi:hypothetical protein